MSTQTPNTVEIDQHELERLRLQASAYQAINTPEIDDFLTAVRNEALHQRERWGAENDEGKTDADWFWLLGYLSGKALNSFIFGNMEKGLHHVISSAAVLLNWHAARTGAYSSMRPGTAQPNNTAAGAN